MRVTLLVSALAAALPAILAAVQPSTYYIISYVSNGPILALGLNGTSNGVVSKVFSANDLSQQWNITLANPGTPDEETMFVQNAQTGGYMTPSSNQSDAPIIVQSTRNTNTLAPPTSYWSISPSAFIIGANGPYSLSKFGSIGESFVLDLNGASPIPGAQLITHSDKGANSNNDGRYNQAWKLLSPLTSI